MNADLDDRLLEEILSAEREGRVPVSVAPADRRNREQEEKTVLERVEYEAGERVFLENPDTWLPFVDGPWDGDYNGPHACSCKLCDGAHATWPIRWRPDGWRDGVGDDWAGEYVLNYVWLPDGCDDEGSS